jgi:peptidoglycan-associated lipoprotein
MTGRTGELSVAGWSSMENVNFKYGSSDLQEKCKEKLANFALWMQNNPLAQVSLDGHQSDADDRNQVLAGNRVTAVRNELIRLGASPDRITIGSNGRQRPVCNASTDTCLELNRRVEILAVRS